jgi:hypothetical protein
MGTPRWQEGSGVVLLVCAILLEASAVGAAEPTASTDLPHASSTVATSSPGARLATDAAQPIAVAPPPIVAPQAVDNAASATDAVPPVVASQRVALAAPASATPPNGSTSLATPVSPLATTSLAAQHERVALLALHMDDLVNRESMPIWLTATAAGVGALSTALSAGATRDTPKFAVPWMLGSGVMAVASTVSLFYSEDAQRRTVLSVSYLPLAGILIGGGLAANEDRVPRLSLMSLGIGYVGADAFSMINSVTAHGVSIDTLRGYRERLATPEGRASLTAQELAQMEAAFVSREPLIPYWLVMSPIGVAGAVALVPAFDAHRTHDARTASAVLGTVGLLQFALSPANQHPVSAFRFELGRLKLSAMSTGNGAALTGIF